MIAILVLTGLFLVFLEFFIVGAIMAIGGVILLVASLVLMIVGGAALSSLGLYTVGVGIALYLVIRLALSIVRKRKVCLDTDQEGYQACSYPKEMIGKRAIVSTDLKPAGYIQTENGTFAALSKSGYIEKGSVVHVVGGEGASLTVIEEVHTHAIQ